MQIASKLLDRLSSVKASGQGKWIAKCPAHKDRSPSLSVALADDGRLLIHCHAGCEALDVLAAAGLEFSDLFPAPLTRTALPQMDCGLSSAEALALVRHEAQVIAILAAQAEAGSSFTQVAAQRIHEAVGRINETYSRAARGF